MKIKMLNDRFDENIKIWLKDDIYKVKNNNSYYDIKEINAVSKIELSKEFEVVI